MIVLHRYKVIFLKTEKTGSTSVERALASLVEDGDLVPPAVRPRWGRMVPGVHGALTRHVPQYFGLHAHATAAQVRSVLGPEVFDSYHKVTIERNPWDRQVSLYTHRQWKRGRGPENFARDMASPVYRATELVRLDNWGIYTIGGRIVADTVLQYASLARDFAAFLRVRGMPEVTLGRHREYVAGRPHYSSYYTDAIREMIGRWYAREIEAFGYRFATAPAAQAAE